MSLWDWLFRRRQRDEELEEEIQAHLCMAAQDRAEQGETTEQSRASAVREFGNVLLVKETTRDMWGFGWLETLMQDLRYGLRQLRRNPGFTAVAVLTLALGIGGTTAIFSVLYGGLLNPFPYQDSDRLAVLVTHDPNQPRFDSWAWVSPSEFLDYQEQNRVFDEVIGGTSESVLLTSHDMPADWFNGMRLTLNTFQVLGMAPVIGRSFTSDDAKPGPPPVVLLGYKRWQTKFGVVIGGFASRVLGVIRE